MVWLKARRDFTFKDTSYRDGEVFTVPPLVAVQMQAQRNVTFAKAPEPAKTRRKRKAPEPVVVEPITAIHHNLDACLTVSIPEPQTEPDEA